MQYGISNSMSAMSVSSPKVSPSMPAKSNTLRSMPCCFCNIPAVGALGLLPSASADASNKKVTISRAPPARLSMCSQALSELAGRFILGAKEDPGRERRHRSASACSRSDMVGMVVRLALGRPCERRRAAVRPAPRASRTGQVSTILVQCTYGVGLGALALSRSLAMTSAFNICRLGDAVVSTPRKTRL